MKPGIAKCTTCQTEFPYEPILVGAIDISRGLHTHCPPCCEAAEAQEAQKRKDAARERKLALRKQTIPPGLLDTSSQHPSFNAALWEAVRDWQSTPQNRSLGIVGPAGVCKTRVLSLLASRVIMRGSRVVWTSAVRLFEAVHDRNSRNVNISTLAREHLQDCKSTPWLFLDDLGKNEWSRSFESQLFQILDHRMNYHLPIAWTSNAHPEEFHTCLSPINSGPIIGRLLDRTIVLDLRRHES